MSLLAWVRGVIDVLTEIFVVGDGLVSRRSVWRRAHRSVSGIQSLEQRCLLTADALTQASEWGDRDSLLQETEPEFSPRSLSDRMLPNLLGRSPSSGGIVFGAGNPVDLPGGGYGVDSMGGDGETPGDDGGVDLFGMGDIPWPDGGADSGDDSGTAGNDVGGDGGGGDGGGGDGGGADAGIVEVDMELPTQSWFEGPFSERKLDRQKVVFTRVDIDGDGHIPGVTATVAFPADQLLNYATPGADFMLRTEGGGVIPLNADSESNTITAQLQLDSPDGNDLFYLVSLMDGDFEQVEFVEVELKSVVAHSMTEVARVADGGRQRAALADGSADLDVASLNEDAEDNPVQELLANRDDDNANEQPDFADHPVNLQDDDLVPLTIHRMLEGATDYSQIEYEGRTVSTISYLVLVFPASVRIYTSNGLAVESGMTQFSDSTVTSLKMEGLSAGRGEVTLHWQVRPMILDPGSDVYRPGSVVFDTIFDSIAYSVRTIDLDIDSDNDNGLASPDRSDWEEVLENHTYGIGKLIYPTPSPPGGVFQNQVFTPVVFQNPALEGEDLETVAVQFDFPAEQGESGFIKIWTVPSNSGPLRDFGIELGGDRITPGRKYSANELVGINTIWIQAVVAQTSHSTRAGAERQKPDDRIHVTAYRRAAGDSDWNLIEGLSDEVKYMVNLNDDVFYPNLQFDHGNRYWKRPFNHTGMVLRDSLIAQGIYDSQDFPQFGLELLDGNQMRALGLSESTVVQIEFSQAVWSSGLRVCIYRDYLSPSGRGYVLAFAGTQMEVADIIADLTQGLGLEGTSAQLGYEPQYNNAMKIAREFSQAADNRQLLPRTTGHSLGGGLASAASVAAQGVLPAATFNAAGLHKNTLMVRDVNGTLTNIEKYQGSLERFVSGANIVSYFTEFDPLTFLQNNMPAIPYLGSAPKAIGKPVQLQAPYDGVVKAKADALLAFLRRPGFPQKQANESYVEWWGRFEEWLSDLQSYITVNALAIVPHHKMTFVQYGLMVNQADNAANPISKRRTWDIFGYSDPE